jgi:hypothetical protein
VGLSRESHFPGSLPSPPTVTGQPAGDFTIMRPDH